MTEHGAIAAVVPLVLGGAAPIILISYALSRSRHPRASAALYLGAGLTIPSTILFLGARTLDLPLFQAMAYLIPVVLLAGALDTVRTPVIAALFGLVVMWAVVHMVGTPTWIADFRRGTMFMSLMLLLIVIFGRHRDSIEAVRSAELRARNQELESLRRTLEDRIGERTSQLARRNDEVRLLLDNLTEGPFTVDQDGKISEYSAALATWFGAPASGEIFYEYMRRQSATWGESAELGWSQVSNGILPAALALDQMPKELVASGRHFHFSYRPIGDSEGKDARFLVVVTEMTAEIERQHLEIEKRETFAILDRAMVDPAGLAAFIREGSEVVAQLATGALDRVATTRALHTLKGTSPLFGAATVARICHDLESRLAEGGRISGSSEYARLTERWARIKSDADRLLGGFQKSLHVSHREYAALVDAVRSNAPRVDLARLLSDLALESVAPRLEQLAEQAKAIASRLGKRIMTDVVHNDVRVNGARWSRLSSVLVHGVRNAVDHGIETSDQRVVLGKTPEGHLGLHVSRDDDGMLVEIEDDGRGVDWERIRTRGAALGLPTVTEEQLLQVMIADGVSTATSVTDISGRGIGMGALASVVRELGGDLSLRSRAGSGTLLALRFRGEAAVELRGGDQSARSST